MSPERLLIEDFRKALAGVASVLGVGLIAIDEAHCVSEWGHDFRPAYLLTGRLARQLCAPNQGSAPPLLALTGTASRAVLKDVQRELAIQEFEAVITPKTFDRPELRFKVIACPSSGKDAVLSSLLSQYAGRLRQVAPGSHAADGSESVTGLVFFPHVNGQFGAAQGLETIRKATGAAVGLYTGAAPRGYPEKSWDRHKRETARRFKRNELAVLACTTAFGMGIDKPNIRFTVHTNLPRSIEGFYQEAGRAGRGNVKGKDGPRLNAQCVLLVSDDWQEQTRQLLNPDLPSDEVYRRLDAIERNQQGDVERQFFFHRQAYGGREGDLRNAIELLGKLGDLDKPRIVDVPYGPSEHDRERTEKAAYRLMAAGVLSDYTHRYEHRILALRITQKDMDGMIAQLEGY
ncbi:MAG: ATP-dependent DNA helicase RecQ, partial [Anaerolineales bacterium]|nr:ATP-dependent DNA helicase RecQ [Anaerolineales bacterium]